MTFKPGKEHVISVLFPETSGDVLKALEMYLTNQKKMKLESQRVSEQEEVRLEEVTQVGETQTAQEEVTQAGETQTAQGEVAQAGETQTAQEGDNKVVYLDQKIVQKLKRSRKAEEIGRAIQSALEFQKKNKVLPSKRELMDLEGCTDHVSRRALEIIEEVTEQTG